MPSSRRLKSTVSEGATPVTVVKPQHASARAAALAAVAWTPSSLYNPLYGAGKTDRAHAGDGGGGGGGGGNHGGYRGRTRYEDDYVRRMSPAGGSGWSRTVLVFLFV